MSLAGGAMLPHTSGILTAVLPCLAYDTEDRRTVREMSRTVNAAQMKLVKSETADGGKVRVLDIGNWRNWKLSFSGGQDGGEKETGAEKLDLPSVMEVLTKQLKQGTVPSKVASLRWIYHLFIQIPVQMFQYIDHSELFPVLLKTLSDTSDEVVILDLEVLAEISSSKTGRVNSSTDTSPHFKQFMLSLLKLFSIDKNLLENKGSFIIRQLCVLLSSEDIYRSMSELLVLEENLKFARVMVETLSTILLTSSELFELRSKLKDLSASDSCQLFCCLYQVKMGILFQFPKSFFLENICSLFRRGATARCPPCPCVCWPAATPTRGTSCGSSETRFVSRVSRVPRVTCHVQEVTVDMLTQLDRLVQLLESPIFTFLRMELLDGDNDLISALYGILMLLPQSEAFNLVR